MNASGAGPKLGWGLAALTLALVFQAGLLFGGSLHHYDWFIHWHYYDWVRIGLQEHGQLPGFMIDAWHTPNFVANAQSPVLGPFVGLLAVLDTESYVKLLIVLYTAFGAAGAFALARELEARPAVAACAAVLWTCSGFFAAHVAIGHHWSLGAYGLPWLGLALRRAIAGSRAGLLGVALMQALPLFEGQHHPFLWQSGLVGLWALLESLRTRAAAPLVALTLGTAIGLALAGPRLVPVLLEFADYAPEARIGGLPPAALLFSLASRAQGPTTPDAFGLTFDHGSGWWEYAFYLGVPGLLFLLPGVVAGARRNAPLLVAGAAAALLCFDTRALGFDVWNALQDLPIASSQRGPSRLLVLAVFSWVFVAAAGWERLLATRRLPARAVTIAFSLWALAIGVDLTTAARPWQQAALGPPQGSRPHAILDPVLAPPAQGTLERLERAPNRLRYRVESDRQAFVVFQNLRHEAHGWTAEALPTVGTPAGAVAVRVPAGTTEIRLGHRTRGMRLGLGLSAAAVLLVAVLGGLGTPLPWRPAEGADRSRGPA